MKHLSQVRAALEVLADFITEARECQPSHAPVTLADLQFTEQRIMTAIDNFSAATRASLDAINASLDGITTGIADLDTLITSLQNSPGTLSAADQAALDAIQASSQSLVAKAAGISTVAPPASAA